MKTNEQQTNKVVSQLHLYTKEFFFFARLDSHPVQRSIVRLC